jgi:hypothetical protein
MPTIKIHNVQTGEIIEREMNAAELSQYQKDKAAGQAEAAKTHERAALLERLGITEDEARLLLGGN